MTLGKITGMNTIEICFRWSGIQGNEYADSHRESTQTT